MISIRKLTRRFYKKQALSDVNLLLPRQAMIGIYGHSGSGKSTLVKAIASLIKYEGTIQVYEEKIEQLNQSQQARYRLEQVGIVYQTYRLFEFETVAWNVKLPLILLGYQDKVAIDTHVNDTLRKLNISHLINRKVATLSGGEKQRVALARTIVKQPRIILADEPTAALDHQNKNLVMECLTNISCHRLVIIVSHDYHLLAQYCDKIYKMQDGKIHSQEMIVKSKKPTHKSGKRLPRFRSRGTLPLSFCIHHAILDFKDHKWRHLLSQTMLIISLLALGIGIQVTSAINSQIKATITSLIGHSGLQVTSRQANTTGLGHVFAAEQSTVTQVCQRHTDLCDDVGVMYRTNINEFFPDRNQIFIISEGPIATLSSLTAQHLAEPLMFDELGLENMQLNHDEIALMVSESDIKIIAKKLSVSPQIDMINQILREKNIFVGAGFANHAWRYEDEQIWRLKKIFLGETAHIVHNSVRFNQFILEISMRFPATTDLYSKSQLPWMLKKVFYLKTTNPVSLMEQLDQDLTLSSLRFDHTDQTYLRNYCSFIGRCKTNRIMVLIDPYSKISLSHLHYINKAESRLSEPILTSSGGYLLYPESMFAGFSNETFFATSQQLIDNIIDWVDPYQIGMIDELPPNCARGYYQDQSASAVKLKQLYATSYLGKPPSNTQEIAISQGLARQLNIPLDALGTQIYIANRMIIGRNELGIVSEFITTQQTLTAISDDNSLAIYGSPFWSIIYYRDELGINNDLLRIERAYYAGETSFLNLSSRRIKATFAHLDTSFPQDEIAESLNGVTNKLELGIYALALIAGFNSILLASIVLQMAWLDIKKDRTLLHELGAHDTHINRLINVRAGLILCSAFITSVIQMSFISGLIDRLLANYFHTVFRYTIPGQAILAMGIFCILSYLALKLIMRRHQRAQDEKNT